MIASFNVILPLNWILDKSNFVNISRFAWSPKLIGPEKFIPVPALISTVFRASIDTADLCITVGVNAKFKRSIDVASVI